MSVSAKDNDMDVDYYCDVASQLRPYRPHTGRDGWTLRLPDFSEAPPSSLLKDFKNPIARQGEAGLTAEEHEFLEGVAYTKFRSSTIPTNILATFPALMGHATWQPKGQNIVWA